MTNTLNSEKLTYFQKVLLIRWINSLDIWPVALKTENMMDELKTGVLLCNMLKFHQPNLDFSGVNANVRARKPCLNNIEKALSVMYQKGVPSRYVLTADEIFDGAKAERIWLMLKNIFEVFAMHDVNVLRPKILAWITSIVQYFNPYQQIPQASSQRLKDFYNTFATGLPMFYIFYLYIKDEQLKPIPVNFFEFPQSKAERMQNLS